MKRIILVTTLYSLAGSLGCGSSTPITAALTTGPSSADLSASLGYCVDFAAGVPVGSATNNCTSATAASQSCTASETSACTTTSRVGSCIYTTPPGVTVNYRYYSAKFTTATAQTNCTVLKGAFTAN